MADYEGRGYNDMYGMATFTSSATTRPFHVERTVAGNGRDSKPTKMMLTIEIDNHLKEIRFKESRRPSSLSITTPSFSQSTTSVGYSPTSSLPHDLDRPTNRLEMLKIAGILRIERLRTQRMSLRVVFVPATRLDPYFLTFEAPVDADAFVDELTCINGTIMDVISDDTERKASCCKKCRNVQQAYSVTCVSCTRFVCAMCAQGRFCFECSADQGNVTDSLVGGVLGGLLSSFSTSSPPSSLFAPSSAESRSPRTSGRPDAPAEGYTDVVDAYGFFKRVSMSVAAKEKVLAENRKKVVAAQRQRWSAFLDTSAVSKTTTVKAMVRQGVPPELRARVWQALCHVPDKKVAAGPLYYHELLREAEEDAASSSASASSSPSSSSSSPSSSSGGQRQGQYTKLLKAIEKDIVRTFPDNANFCDARSESIQMLRRVLLAYAVRNPLVGYCQALSTIVAIFLLLMEEEDAFWMLASTVEDICCISFKVDSPSNAKEFKVYICACIA